MSTTKRHKKRKNKQKGGLFPFEQDNSFLARAQELPGKIVATASELKDKITATSSVIKDRLQAGIAAVRGPTGGSTRKHRKHRKH